jgi:uncharacterized protein (TIGR03435 family)
MRRIVWLAVALAPFVTEAQENPGFEAASIRASSLPDNQTYFEINDSGRLIVRAMDVWDLVARAFGMRDSLMSDGPSWIKSDGFDIQATPRAPVARERALEMLKTLLEDRFHLRWHQEMREMTVYALRVVPGGPKLAPAKEGQPAVQPGNIHVPSMTMGTLCNILEHETRRLVVDQTGLTGSYAIELRWSRDTGIDTSLASLFTAMREQLGLRLESEKLPMKVLVIDDAQRPSAN